MGSGGGLLGAGALCVLGARGVCGVGALHGSWWPGGAGRWAAGWPGPLSGGGLVAGGLWLPVFALVEGIKDNECLSFLGDKKSVYQPKSNSDT